jgi:hypothetical protein
VCEGEVTEPTYIRGFRDWCRNPLVHVTIAKDHGVPRTVVQIAKEQKLNAAEDARKQDDENLDYDEVWAVYDVDAHPNMNDAWQMAVDNGIQLAISNPCFELWILLHFRESPGAHHRHAVQKMVAEFIPGYKKTPGFELLRPGYADAVIRAKRLDAAAESVGEGGRNPTTGVYKLMESIRAVSDHP